jgi:hypothetical protein
LGDFIDCCCQNGASFVAVADERTVGFLLTKSSGQPEERKLEYGCVASDYRCRGIFPSMVDEAKVISVRLDAIVKDANKSGMAVWSLTVLYLVMSARSDGAGRACVRGSHDGLATPPTMARIEISAAAYAALAASATRGLLEPRRSPEGGYSIWLAPEGLKTPRP